jgi:sarcosine oxidase subunit gamma
MVEPYLRRSPLAHKSLTARAAESHPDAGVQMGESPHRCQINLRGNIADPAFANAVSGVLGLALPTIPNRTASAGGLTAFWLAPDEWLVVGAPGREKELAPALKQALAGQHAAAVDLSEARTVIVVAGRNARELLQKGTPLDLHPREFQPGHCAQTALSKVNAILHQTDASPRYDIYVLNSFADYLWNWLERAAEEYGLSVIDAGK